MIPTDVGSNDFYWVMKILVWSDAHSSVMISDKYNNQDTTCQKLTDLFPAVDTLCVPRFSLRNTSWILYTNGI